MVTLSNLMESRGRVEVERGDLSVNMESKLRRVGSEKEGKLGGLSNLDFGGEATLERGGKLFVVNGGTFI